MTALLTHGDMSTTTTSHPVADAAPTIDPVDPSTGLHSAIYEGTIAHSRMANTRHAFTSDVAMAYLALEELPEALDNHPLWSARHAAPMRFRREDFHGAPGVPLADAVRATVAEATGTRPTGPIRLLAHLRTWGWSFNPIAFYFVLTPDRTGVETMVAEVTNTPWHERHAYVVPVQNAPTLQRTRVAKAMHVSPFMDMDLEHDFSFTAPGADHVRLDMDDWRGEDKVFAARLSIDRRPLDRSNMSDILRRHPLPAQSVSAGIYRQALALRLKGAPFRRHPKHATASHPARSSS